MRLWLTGPRPNFEEGRRPRADEILVVRSRGFSLVELLVAVLLLGMLLALGSLTWRGSTLGADTRGLAWEVVAELRAAREEALRRRVPVAVCFSSPPATRGFTGRAARRSPP